MIIKNLWLWHKNSSWSDEDFVMFGIVVLSLLCAFITGMVTFWGLSLFGPWFQGSGQVWFFTWLGVVGQQFYFWGRYSRYSMLYRQNRLNKNTGEVASKKWFNFKSREQKQREKDDRKLQERRTALGFADDLKRRA